MQHTLTPEQEYQLEQKRLQQLDDKILPLELKEEKSTWKSITTKVRGLFGRLTDSKKKYIVKGIRPLGAPTYNPVEAGMVVTEQPHPDYYNALVRQRGEVITPLPDDTAEDIADLMSQAACDHEFRRVIVYPVEGEKRKKVMELLLTNPERYPMYEYLEANIVNNDDLNSRTIIYKYGGPVHICKPI